MATREEVRRVSIYINGDQADLTTKQLEKGFKKLRDELGRLVPGTEEFKEKLLELQQTRKVIQDVRDDINGVGGAFGWLKTEIGKLGALAVGYMGFEFITEQFKNIITQNAKLADSISDIQKTTGLSETAVRRLQHGFKEIDTRSSREQLSSLAEVAGKLGISSERDVAGFVRAADKINVALGEDLGDAEGAINDLGKLTELFKIKDAYGLEDALIRTGSAINELGAAGTANEGYLVEFTKRMGGIAPAANMSIQDILGLASVMDELGQPTEASATAIGQFVTGMGKDIPKFANIAKMSIKDFSDLLMRDGNQALIAVLRNVESTGMGIAGLSENMGLLGEDGARAVTALGALSNNLQLLEKRQRQSNHAFDQGTSLLEEFNTKNNNFAAALDRLKKRFHEIVSNSSFTDFLIKCTNATIGLFNAISKASWFITKITQLVFAGAVAYGAYNAVLIISTILQGKWITTLMESERMIKLITASQTAWTVISLVLQGRIADARRAMILFNTTMSANPIGLVVAAIAGLITAMSMMREEISATERAQQALKGVEGEAQKRTLEQTTLLRQLNEVLKDENASREKKLSAVNKLNEVMPDVLEGLTAEEALTNKGTIAINNKIRAIERETRAQAAKDKILELQKKNVDLKTKEVTADDVGFWDGWKAMAAGYGQAVLAGKPLKGHDLYNNYRGVYGTANRASQIKANEDLIKTIQETYAGDLDPTVPTGGKGGGTGTAAFDLASATKAQLEKQLADDLKLINTLKKGTADYNKVAAEMVAIRKRLKEINRDMGIGNGVEDHAKQLKSRFEALQAQVKELSSKAHEDSLTKNAKELFDAEKKYDALIAKEKDFLKEKGVLASQRKQTEENIRNLELQKTEDVNAIRVRQEREMLAKIKTLRAALQNVYETELEAEARKINEFYDGLQDEAASWDDWYDLELARAYDLAEAKIREEERWADAVKQIRSESEVAHASADDVELARINKKYDDQIEALKRKFGKEKAATQEFQDAIELINKNRQAEIKQKDANKAKREKDERIEAEFAMAQTLSDGYFNIAKNGRQAETDVRIKQLEDEREAELSKKSLTEKQKLEINERYDKQQAEIKQKAWEADRQAALSQAAINGALAITKALILGPASAWVIPGIIASTAVQVATIMSQKPPQFEDGGYSAVDYKSPQGFVNRPTLFAGSASGRAFIAGEGNKTEYIVSSAQLRNPQVANFVAMLEAQRVGRYFENGGYSATATPAFNSTNSTGAPGQATLNPDMAQLMAMLATLMGAIDKVDKKQVALSFQTLEETQVRIANERREARGE